MAGADDILGALLSSSMGGGQQDEMDPETMGALKAYQGSDFLQGQPSHSGPLGQISQAIMPLIAAKIYGEQAKSKASQQHSEMLFSAIKLANEIDDRELKKMELEQKLHPDYKPVVEFVKAIKEAGGDASGVKTTLKGPMGSTVTFGGAKPADTLFGLIGAEQGGDTSATPKLERYADLQARQAGAEAQKRSDVAIEQFKKEEQIKRELPAKMSEKDRQVIHSGEALLGLLDEAPTAIGSLPADVNRSGLAMQAAKYQAGSEHPTASNLITGLTGGLVSTDTDPKMDQYFSWIGQVKSALASFNLEGQRGGFRTLQYLQDHFPGYQDSPERARDKVKWLVQNKGIIQQKINAIHQEIEKSASTATDLDASGIPAESQGSWMKVPMYNQKTKQQAFMWVNPTTGQTRSSEPAE